MDPKKSKNLSPRIKVIQKLYNALMNSDALIEYPKSQYKKFIKDIVSGTIEREEILLDKFTDILKNEFNPSRTDLILKIMMYHNVILVVLH